MKRKICTECGTAGKPKKTAKGSMLIELVLWLAFIIPGLIYSLWRLTTKTTVCRTCGSVSLIPEDSPRGQRLAAEMLDGFEGAQHKALTTR